MCCDFSVFLADGAYEIAGMVTVDILSEEMVWICDGAVFLSYRHMKRFGSLQGESLS